MNNDPDDQSIEAILVCLFDEDIEWCDKIVQDLNENYLPGLNLKKVTVRKLLDNNQMGDNLINYDEIRSIYREKNLDSGFSQLSSSIDSFEKQYKSHGYKKKEIKSLSKTTQSASMDSKLLNELKKLREDKFCANCQNNEKSIMFLPCSHLVLCSSCSSKSELIDRCSVCNKKVEATIKAFL
jgi:hypothetical protein